MRRLLAVSVLLVVAMAIGIAPATAHVSEAHGERHALLAPGTAGAGVAMQPVANVQYPLLGTQTVQNGSDIEFLKVGAKEYALAGTLRNGLQIVDVTAPATPAAVAVYACPITQGDIQVFRQGERILAAYTADAAIGTQPERLATQCVTEANALGAEIDGSELGTFLVDLTDPTQPKTAGFFEVPEGSHNQTVHPSGDYLYNSNSDLLGVGGLPEVTIFDIRDPAKPRHVQNFGLSPYPTSLGTESHDIFFNGNGTRAYVAALSHTAILDTSNPEAPSIIHEIVDPSIQVVHQSDLVSLPRADGSVRDLLVITDERAGAAAGAECPGGGLHIYDVTGDLENNPAKLGSWFINVTATTNGDVCTSHVLRFYPDQKLMTIAWYTQGVRVVDISGLADLEGNPASVAFGDGAGMKEIGNYVFDDADTWSFKTNRIAADGSFFGYGNDLGRGLDIYRFDPEPDLAVPALEPEDLAAPGCSGVPQATAYVDRAEARDVHERSIDCVIARQIARGSVKDAKWYYEPLAEVTRAQMASFIASTLRAAGVDEEFPDAPTEDKFTDIAENPHRANINLLAEAGIISGVSEGKYDPGALVSRAQMATFMVKAAQFAIEPDLVESGGERFADVSDANTHKANIELGSDHALFSGTRTGQFSPAQSVVRDQMASFLVNLLTRLGGPDGPGRPVAASGGTTG